MATASPCFTNFGSTRRAKARSSSERFETFNQLPPPPEL
jgi:hypothetical protein